MQAFADSELAHDLARDLEFERLYRRYARDVYRYSLAVLRNPADAEDITQTTFLNAYRAYLRGEEPVRPRHWLIKIAHNACRSRHLRAARRPHEVPLEETIAAVSAPPYEAPKVEELLAALGRLPFNQRAAIVMRELEGRSYAEISDTLEVSVAAVETLIFRARRTLRRDRSLFGSLSAVQLPPSLTSLFAGGSGAVTGGSAAAGSGALFKLLLMVTAGVVAGTVGTGVDSVLGKNKRPAPTAVWEPEGLVASTGSVPGALGSSAGLRGPIVITRDGRTFVVGGWTFGTDPGASLGSGLFVYRGVVSGAKGLPGTALSGPGGDPVQAQGKTAGVALVEASTSAATSSVSSVPTPSVPPVSSDPVQSATAAATTTVADATSSAGVPSAPDVPSVPSVPSNPVPIPSTPPVALPPPPSVAVPDLPVAVPPIPSLAPPPDPPHVP